MNFKSSIFILFLCTQFSCFSQKEKQTGNEEFTVIELFTSQGCHSCPPADRLLSKLFGGSRKSNTQIFPLSFHVDYWNYLGWDDPYSNAEFSKRQRRYADALDSGVYTPQMVFNGTAEAVGSRTEEVRRTLKKVGKTPIVDLKIKVNFDDEGKPFAIDYSIDKLPQKAVLNVAIVERGIEDSVKRGENRGKVLHHDNVVRWFKQFKISGKNDLSGNVYLDFPKDVKTENASVVLYLQNSVTLEILSAAKADLF